MPKKRSPSKKDLNDAIAEILAKAVNADSQNAPKQMHIILSAEKPYWKLNEKRVAKYMKRQLKAMNDPKADEIDADIDEESVYSTASSRGSAVRQYGGVSGTKASGKPQSATPYSVNIGSEVEIKSAESDLNAKASSPAFCDGCIVS